MWTMPESEPRSRTLELTRRYRFSASHRLYSDELSDEQNRATFGKCANPYGHGHDYVLEVTVRGALDPETGRVIDLDTMDRIVGETVTGPMEHANLNTDIGEFRDLVPTTENLAVVIRQRLDGAWSKARGRAGFAGTTLERIRIEETKRNFFEVERESK